MVLYVGIVGARRPNITEKEFKKILDKFFDERDPFHEEGVCVISGGAQGIDTWAKLYAVRNQYCYRIFKPDPKLPFEGKNNRYFLRNELIAKTSDILLAFPSRNEDGKPKGGTLNTINHAKRLGIEVIIY